LERAGKLQKERKMETHNTPPQRPPHVLSINISVGNNNTLSDEYQKQLNTASEEVTSLEIYTDCSEYPENKKSVYLFYSDLLLAILENNPNIKEISVEGYERYCISKQYMVHTPSEFGLFYTFTALLESYQQTGETPPYLTNIERMNFKKCSLNENDLRVLGSSLFPNLKSVLCFYCTPTDILAREKYRDFIPFLEWDDKYEYDIETGIKNKDFYANPDPDQVIRGYYTYY